MTLPGPLGEGGRGLGQQTPLFPAQSSHPVLPHPLRRTPPLRGLQPLLGQDPSYTQETGMVHETVRDNTY